MSEIQKTINYFQFKLIEGNRPVDPQHVAQLVAKINLKNMLHLCPILVNSQMGVIEGQHRLAAAEKLGLYIYYIISDDIGASDMATLNSANKNWKMNDYINYWTVNKRQGFDIMSEFMIENPLLPPSTVLMMINSGYKRDLESIRKGEIDVSNIREANTIAGIIREYAEVINFAYDRNFVMAIMKCIKTPEYDHEHMKAKLEYQRKSLYRCVSVKQYCEMLSEIYNHSVSAKNHIKIAA